jgi:hypothetical protein
MFKDLFKVNQTNAKTPSEGVTAPFLQLQMHQIEIKNGIQSTYLNIAGELTYSIVKSVRQR